MENLTEEDIQWLAKILAMIPVLEVPTDTVARLLAHDLIAERSGGWEATEKGILTIINWKVTD